MILAIFIEASLIRRYIALKGIFRRKTDKVSSADNPPARRPTTTQPTNPSGLVPFTQILFGSDNPFVSLAQTAEGILQLGISADDFQPIGRDNALALLPRLNAS